jgi:hypothetical protein
LLSDAPGVLTLEAMLASPRSAAWPKVESAIRSLIDGKLPADTGPGAEKR